MKANKLAGLRPEAVFAWFEKICQIPHGSGNTKAISDFLADFARQRGLRYIQDELNDVIIFADASAGYEDHPPVILQGHMDMVCQKDADCPIDMHTQGLDVTHDGTWVWANGTTLGGDDGIAVAYALALLDDPSLVHPPLEVVITVDEETGMDGAAGIDLSVLSGRSLLNIDSEEEGIFTVACAGGGGAMLRLEAPRKVVMGPCIRLTVEKLRGGHSGVEIHKNRANANKVMGQVLEAVSQAVPLRLSSLAGGDKDNAIPRSCSADAVVLSMYPDRINEILEQLQQQIRQQYDEPEVVIRGENVDAFGSHALTEEATRAAIRLLNRVPNGVQSWSQQIPGLVQTSLNLGVMNLTQEALELRFSVRSSVNAEKHALLDELEQIGKETENCACYRGGEYPAWEYQEKSPLRDTMIRVYRQMYGKEPEVVSIHAGLECGLLSEKLPGLDCVSIGPDMRDIHTSREKLSVASTERVWQFLLELLKAL